MLLLSMFLLVIVLLVFNFIFITNDRGHQLIKKLPGPKSYMIIGNAMDSYVSPVELFRLFRRYAKTFKNGIYGWWTFNINIVNLFNPEDIEKVISGMHNTEKGFSYTIMKPWLREGLLTSKGSKWQHRRKILTPTFHFNILKRFLVTLEENSHRLVDILAKTQDTPIDIIPIMSEHTLSCICATSMGTQLHEGAKNARKIYKEALYGLGNLCIDRLSKVYLLYETIFNLSSNGRRTYKLLNTVRSFTESVINDRKKLVEKDGNEFDDNAKESTTEDLSMNGIKKRAAMLDLLISEEKQGTIDSIGIQEEVDTFMFAGHDSSAAVLIYCMMLLANHKEVQDGIVVELNNIFKDDRMATMEDLNEMRYLECCIKESMRLYPPVHFMGRILSEDTVLSGYTVAKGTQCHIHIYDLHRNENLYKNAAMFDPDRFLPENCVGRHPYAYIPFSAGPRNCIAELFKVGRRYAKTFKNGIYGFWALNLNVVNIFNAEDIEKVISGMQNTEKGFSYTVVKPWLREGLLTSQGSKWQHRRKILTPTFHFNILKRFLVTLEENSRRLVDILSKTQDTPIDIVPIMSEHTLNCICETSMGTQLHEGAKNAGKIYKEALYGLGKLCVDRLIKVYLLSETICNLSFNGRRTYKLLKTLRSFTESVIKDRKKLVEKDGNVFDDMAKESTKEDLSMNGIKKRTAMLDLLISEEKQGTIDSIGIQEEVDTFMFAGHDTTADVLIFSLMLLANHKEVQDTIVVELNNIFKDDRLATMEDLNEMRYLECCIKESMRLYPPVPFIGRKLSEDTVLSGYTVAKGTQCNIHIYDLHRNENLYKNAAVFDPERFLPENCVGRHPYAYIPFSAGPRNCIGQKFAMMELKSCLSSVLRKFEVLPVTTPDDMEFTADLVLRSAKPVYVDFVGRK